MKYILFTIIIFFGLTTANSQCYPNRHNTTWFDSWISCDKSPNPNSARGESHWIMYDLGYIYKLEEFYFWNINDPAQLDNGVKNLIIDYSIDGSTWIEFGVQHFNKASGKSIYEGEHVFDFDGIKARYLLMTVQDNWGGKCSGFAEFKIEVSPITATEMVDFDLDCTETDGYTKLEWSLTNDSKTVAFEVEKSIDQNKWNTVYTTGKIAVKNTKKRYSYMDKSIKDAYYRIKISDDSGEQVYTNPKFCSSSNIIVTAFPNPFIDNLKIDVVAQTDEPIIYSLNDIYGRSITKGIISPDSRINNLDFDNFDLKPGNYFFIVRQGDKSGQVKMVKLNNP